ncbi:protein translocase subunit SecA2, chloroplastic isoform X1 [Tanacetum coccineum]
MNRSLFTRIVRDLFANCPYFQEGCDAVGKAGISTLVKCTSAIRQLAYAAVPNSLDEYLQIGEKISRDYLMHVCNGVIELYGEEYLRRPTQIDIEKLYAFHENKHGFPGMIGSIDYTKWPWAECLQAHRAQFGWIWAVLYEVYFRSQVQMNVKRIRYKQAHEAARKDVERAFGVIKKKWAMLMNSDGFSGAAPTFIHGGCFLPVGSDNMIFPLAASDSISLAAAIVLQHK